MNFNIGKQELTVILFAFATYFHTFKACQNFKILPYKTNFCKGAHEEAAPS